jgi:hypothetical protein
MESLYTTALKNILPHGTMFHVKESYQSLVIEDGVPKPSLEEVNKEIENIKKLTSFRRTEYPSPNEWIIALVQKEIDNDSSEWDSLVEKRSSIRNKYKKNKNEGVEVHDGI